MFSCLQTISSANSINTNAKLCKLHNEYQKLCRTEVNWILDICLHNQALEEVRAKLLKITYPVKSRSKKLRYC